MGLDNMRGSGRCPPFLVGGLIVICMLLSFNWWTMSAQNYELVKQLEHLGEQLKICSDEQDVCVHQRLSAEGRIKSLDGEIATLRVHEEQSRAENEEINKKVTVLSAEMKSMTKERDDVQNSAVLCNTELESLKKLDISKDGTIATLRIEKERFGTQLEERKQETQKLRLETEQLKAELKTKQSFDRGDMKIPMPKNAAATKLENGDIAVGGNHEHARAQDADRAEIEEDNARERGDETNVDPDVGDAQLVEVERMVEANDALADDTPKKSNIQQIPNRV